MYFYGLGQCAKNALIDIKSVGQEKLLKGVIDSKKTGEWENYQIVDLDNVDKNEVIVITVKMPEYIEEIKNVLEKKGFFNIYYYNCRRAKNNFLKDSCTLIKNWGDAVLPHVEMHISDHCNLNCKGCTHYSALFEKNFPKFENAINDVIELKSKCSHIIRFYIMGGEPFLNPEIDKYIREITNILSGSDVWIVTNGLLLLSVNEEILKLISKLNVIVSISEYDPTHRIMSKIINRLDKYNVTYDIRPFDKKQKFIKPLSLNNNSIYPNICISDGCINIWNGKIARCPSLMYVKRLNEYFDINLPEDGIMDLYDCPEGKELVNLLKRKVPLCSHCVDNKIDWGQCDMNNIRLEDFVTER